MDLGSARSFTALDRDDKSYQTKQNKPIISAKQAQHNTCHLSQASAACAELRSIKKIVI